MKQKYFLPQIPASKLANALESRVHLKGHGLAHTTRMDVWQIPSNPRPDRAELFVRARLLC